MREDNLISRRKFMKGITAAGIMIPFTKLQSRPTPETPVMSEHDICVFSKHLQFLPDYDTMAEVAAEIGFDGIDLAVRPGGHVLPENVEKDLPKAVNAIRKAGLKVPMIVTKIGDPNDSLTEPVLRSASAAGIKYYRMDYYKLDKNLNVIQSLSDIKEYFINLAELNQKFNIIGMYQNHSGNRFGGPVWDIWEVLKETDSTWIGCQYDIRHATVEGAYSWPQGMELVAPFIKTTAIKDFYWIKDKDNWKIENCTLGTGMVDFKSYFQLYKKLDISGPITMHFEYKHYNTSDSLTAQRKSTVDLMKKDLNTLRSMLKEYGL